MTICILGRQPKLSLAELESVYGASALTLVQPHVVRVDYTISPEAHARLGGVMKTAKILTTLPTTNWTELVEHCRQHIPEHVTYLPEGKLKLGLSVYDLPVSVKTLQASGLSLKKAVKATGRSVRVVPNTAPELNSAQVLHNQLTSELGWELLFIRDGQATILAQTTSVQNIDNYSRRDFERPGRDAFVGMLPPKLAQIMINLASPTFLASEASPHLSREPTPEFAKPGVAGVGASPAPRAVSSMEWGDTPDRTLSSSGKHKQPPAVYGTRGLANGKVSEAKNKRQPPRLLDPFCGTGVVLLEAALMNYPVYGTDLSERMVSYSRMNLEWLQNLTHQTFNYHLEAADATTHTWQQPIDTVVCETYLGQPLTTLPRPERLDEIVRDCNDIVTRFLQNIRGQLPTGGRLCVAVPAWKTPAGFRHLPVVDELTPLGYNRISFTCANNAELIYHREGQVVARELLVLTRIT